MDQQRVQRGILCLLIVALGMSALAGCASVRSTKPSSPPPMPTADAEYRVAAGDEFELIGSQVTKPARFQVARDGTILLPDGRSLLVDNRTADEIARLMEKAWNAPCDGCKIKVLQCNSQFLYVFGAGKDRGARAVSYRGRETVPELLRRVGVPKAKRGYRVRLVRPSAIIGAPPEVVVHYFDSTLREKKSSKEPFHIQPEDYVYVEKDKGKHQHAWWPWSDEADPQKLAIREPRPPHADSDSDTR